MPIIWIFYQLIVIRMIVTVIMVARTYVTDPSYGSFVSDFSLSSLYFFLGLIVFVFVFVGLVVMVMMRMSVTVTMVVAVAMAMTVVSVLMSVFVILRAASVIVDVVGINFRFIFG